MGASKYGTSEYDVEDDIMPSADNPYDSVNIEVSIGGDEETTHHSISVPSVVSAPVALQIWCAALRDCPVGPQQLVEVSVHSEARRARLVRKRK